MYTRFKKINRAFDDKDYSRVIGDNVKGNPRVIDVAMLGAHDAFSSGIHMGSERDPLVLEQFPIMNSDLVHSLTHRYSLRMVKAQYSYADVLLKKGVRYFDVRLSYYKNGWYTKHGLISDKFSVYLTQIIKFLEENPTEFVILDVQHFYAGKSNADNLTEYIESVKVNGKSIFDYLNYDPTKTALKDLDYRTVTCGGTKGGVVFLLKHPVTEKVRFHYVYEESIRSLWHNTFSYNKLVKGIEEEYKKLSACDDYKDIFRVNQSQLTGITGDVVGVVTSVFRPSLLVMAEYSNPRIADSDTFIRNLSVMPIYMVDFANCIEGDFNNVVNGKIAEYNSSL